MLTNSRDIKRRLEKEGWSLERVTGSHHVFLNPVTGAIISLPHPKKDLGRGVVWAIHKAAGRPKDCPARMTHYVAIVEEEDGKAFGVWFRDLPGCVSGGDTLDEAMANASEALALWVDVARQNGLPVPASRSLTELKSDAAVADEMRRFMVALIALDPRRRQAA
jgi:predicted RNase H-like HicB family nuclease/predicted RNA binding protein YcfA (HicA-like mRNA interferase family)